VNFSKIPGSPISYWVVSPLLGAFDNLKKIQDIGDAKSGLQTGNNNKFLRFWFEIEFKNIDFNIKDIEQVEKTTNKWFPHVKGGSYRKWYGNHEYVINFGNNGEDIKNHKSSVIRSPQFYFKEGITWSHTTSHIFGSRYLPQG